MPSGLMCCRMLAVSRLQTCYNYIKSCKCIIIFIIIIIIISSSTTTTANNNDDDNDNDDDNNNHVNAARAHPSAGGATVFEPRVRGAKARARRRRNVEISNQESLQSIADAYFNVEINQHNMLRSLLCQTAARRSASFRTPGAVSSMSRAIHTHAHAQASLLLQYYYYY